ncbi:hypothetical protein PUNSTDRAFT_130997 [Punctularia strigosozonata HHB-11173 SS5]|uniref:uncharacterized protein n=1 Tax=Punctularia strigosozonata (strain HHB-11173) TaxID=741275 RepID=UPI000441700E|nr:uncharacterized protein PUNSTDRAFT_130997 [Punctularia strigosozonata HHB-11173 SS5]EIN12754.1 hypothetical protein PUNSTDRAFT_130997 [Punctularia strigosozonata HHB-11173 SS5]
MNLPTELIIACLRHIYYGELYAVDKASLLSCALVAKSWTGPAQELLFRSVRGRQFLQALQSPSDTIRLSQLSAYVVKCDIAIGRSQDSQASILRPSDLITLLRALPKLYELTLRVHYPYEFDGDTLDELRAQSGCQLRALNFMQSGGVQSLVLYQLLGVWRTIRHLRIGCEVRSPPLWALQIKLDLYELSMFRMPTLGAFDWLLSPSVAPNLQILELRDVPSRSSCSSLDAHVHRLRSLRVGRLDLSSSGLISRCSNLGELVLYQIPTILPLDHSQLPRTIVHLSFRNPGWGASEALGSLLSAVRLLPMLKLVTCDQLSTATTDYHKLLSICADRSIALYHDDLPMWMFEDPIPIRMFPRRKSVSNFGTMRSIQNS